MNTQEFKTRTDFIERKHPGKGDDWVIGLDAGYSSMKIFAPNGITVFPAMAKKAKEELSFSAPGDNDIKYRKDGVVWEVGASAEALMDVNDSELALYGRMRYFSEVFKVITDVGLAIGMRNNSCGSMGVKKPFIQTGLPPKYLKDDAPYLKEVLSGHHEFDIKIGSGEWESFDFTIEDDRIDVMDQPKAGLVCAATTINGKPSADARRYFSNYVLLLDVGFGTADIYDMRNGKVATDPQTFTDLGMRRVFEETCNEIQKKIGKSVSVPMLQNALTEGQVRSFNRIKGETVTLPIGEILSDKTRQVCDEFIGKLMDIYTLEDYQYVILDGGTSHAWAPFIKDKMKQYFGDGLSVVSATGNDNIAPVFGNARGYYFYRMLG